jgi:hypothetical protein
MATVKYEFRGSTIDMMKNYQKEKAANAKVIQVLIADAEKDRKEAEFIFQRNRELESKQIV